MNNISSILERCKNNMKYYVGYPQNTHFDYSNLFEALSYPINNCGDPFVLTNTISSHEYEQEVIRWFLKLFGLDEHLGWGYITSCSTEGILFGIWQAKENLHNPILYFSDYAHYSVLKSAKITGLEYKVIHSSAQGEMDYDDLQKKLDPNRDAIVLATLGNTMTSAIDNVASIKKILNIKNINSYIHADAAFDGMILPFIDSIYPHKLTQDIDSISVSGHKIIGSPIPCGIVLIHKKYLEKTKRVIDYIYNIDCTVSGSRAGFSALILWEAIRKNNFSGFKKLISTYIEKAEKFTGILNDNNIRAWRFNHAITIVLDKLPEIITKKWRAPSDMNFTTLTALPKLTEEMLHDFIGDIIHINKFGRLSDNTGGLLYPTITENIKLSFD